MKRAASVISFEPGAAVEIHNGRFHAHGTIVGPGEDDETWIVDMLRNRRPVPIQHIRLAKMSAEKPWEDAPREMLEQQLGVMATQLAAAQAESAGMLEVIAMQCDALGALQAQPTRPIKRQPVAGTADHGFVENEWYEGLIDRLETYLVQQTGQRHPLHIADMALRDLVSHILD